MALGKTSSAVKNKYNAKAYDSLRVTIPKGRKEDVENVAKGEGETVNGFVNELLRNKLGMNKEAWGYKKKGGKRNDSE